MSTQSYSNFGLGKRTRTLPHPWQYGGPQRETQVTRGVPGGRWTCRMLNTRRTGLIGPDSSLRAKERGAGVPGDARVPGDASEFQVILEVTSNSRGCG